MTRPDFKNTKIAFRRLSDADLFRAYSLFKTLSYPKLVAFGTKALTTAMAARLPVGFLVEQTIYRHFCGGNSIAACTAIMNSLASQKVQTILDYSVEGKDNEKQIDESCAEILRTIAAARANPQVSFCVFKPTGVARVSILEKVSAREKLSPAEKSEFERGISRFNALCDAAAAAGKRIFIDAEDSWFQQAIDDMALAMMKKHNRETPIVHTTLQMYRHDRLAYLHQLTEIARRDGFKLGIKLVRGAYMEKERERARLMGYPSPIQKDKDATDRDYNEALRYMMEHIDLFSICAGTHNEASALYLVELTEAAVKKGQLKPEQVNERIHFSQLLGMSDHISFNLADAGYAVSKYVPYGPVREVLPYLTRRAEENTSIRGQTGREMSLISQELGRRRASS